MANFLPEVTAFSAPGTDCVRADVERVIRTEARALETLAQRLDPLVENAVALLLQTRGRVIVSGMGKSGHISRKIAASLSSTGTPAFFVHPGEAAHGDLGMITEGDTLLAISYSGRSGEIDVVIKHAIARKIPVIAITSNSPSAMARAADVPLILPKLDEACFENIAPTSSTTMALALGDGLALATMRCRGFGAADMRQLHPGGTIGTRLSLVEDFMHTGLELPLVTECAPMREAIVTMTACSLGIAGVVDAAGLLVGVITDGDLRRHIDELFDSAAGDVMTRGPATVDHRLTIGAALDHMRDNKITALFVTRGDAPARPIGVLHIHDLLRAGLD